MKRPYFIVMGIGLLIVGAVLFKTSLPQSHFAIYVDAGSSGSRLHFFKYTHQHALPKVKELFSASTQPGLASFAAKPTQAVNSLKELLDKLTPVLAKQHLNPQAIEFHLLGTGGMRLLPEKTQQAIYKNIADHINTYYHFTIHEIKTIPGQEEGLYGWLAINYLLKKFTDKIDHTEGSIDMGGASTQLVFSVPENNPSAHQIKLQLEGKNYTVYTRSFLGLGLNQALATIKRNPLAASCFPKNYPLSSTNSGNFDFAGCSHLYQQLIHQQINHLPLPSDKNFLGYSGIFYTYHFFDILQQSDPGMIQQHIKTTCTKSWPQLKKEHADIPTNLLASYCAHGVYLYNLVYATYHLTAKQLTVASEINHETIDWTLGALINSITIPSATPSV